MNFTKEIFDILQSNYPELLNFESEEISKYYDPIKKIRAKSAELEIEEFIRKGDSLPQLSETHPFEVTQKYRIDYMYQELKNIKISVAISISTCDYYLPKTSDLKHGAAFTYDDFMYWYNIDYGIRLVSSAWDRLSHYLYLAFEIGSPKLDINLVLREMPKKFPNITTIDSFKNLKKIRDERLNELKDKYSRGLRNEIDHILSSYTRFYLLTIEKWKPEDKASIDFLINKRKESLYFLKQHFDIFIEGYNLSIELVSKNNLINN